MTRRVVTDQQAGFAGGLNSVSDPAFLRPDQARQMANIRLSSYGAALKRLGTQLTTAAAISTFDTTNSVYGGIYWPTRDQIYAIGGSSSSRAMALWETAYHVPATWSALGTVMQYRPVIFTDGVNSEVMYLAGDNTRQLQKASPAYSTISADARMAVPDATGAAALTWSHTVGVGANPALIVFLMFSGTTGATSVVRDPSGTPQALTRLAQFSDATQTVEIWYVTAPAAGAKTMTATWAAPVSRAGGASASYFGVHQTTPFEMSSPRTASGASGTTASVSVPATARDWVVDAVRFDVLSTVTPGGGQTTIGANANGGIAASDKVATAPLTTMEETIGASGAWIYMAAAMQPAPASPDLTIASLPSDVASVKGLTVYNDRLWGWNGFGFPNSLYFSELSSVLGSTGGDSLGNPAAGGGEIIIRTFGISEIVACAPVGGSLLIWHERGISRLTGFGQDDISVAPQALTADVGMANATPSGLCVYDNIAYFISDRGMYRANESSVGPLSTPDKPDPTAALLAAGTVDPSQFTVVFNRQFQEVWVAIDSIGIYIYNTVLQSWSGPFTGTYADGTRAIFEVVNSATGNSHLWRTTWRSSGPTAGMFVSECDRATTYTDDTTSAGSAGTAVTATLQLHRLFGDDRVLSKSWRWLNMLAQFTSGATPPVATFTTQLGGTNAITFSDITSIEQAYYLSPGGMGPWLDVTITDAGATGPSQYALATVQGNLLGQR